MALTGKWSFSVDRGGTFTDVIGVAPGGAIHTLKLLSKSSAYPDSSLEGIRRVLSLPENRPIPENLVREIRMGTTVATNALLERKGEPTALFITRGFRDLLEIGYQDRADIFSLAVTKPEQLYCEVCEISQRTGFDGKTIEPLDPDNIKDQLQLVKDKGIRSIAVVYLHSWKNPDDEIQTGAMANKMGFEQVSLSSELVRRIKVVGRGQTTMVDAYLSPVLKAYVDSLKQATGEIPVSFMQSSGGLADAAVFTGKDSILSGPAGGVIGAAAVAGENTIGEIIGFDMGGTSTDVCRFGGSFDRRHETETGGIRFQSDMLSIETVASGGGSILGFDGRRMTVGPESAGADPGPACYGKGGPLTVTDANLVLGRIIPEAFERSFAASGGLRIDYKAAHDKFNERVKEINNSLPLQMRPEEAALGYIRIANEIMAKPIKAISISKGFDIRTHTLLAFGGAGALHACSIARILGIEKILIHPMAGLFSAYGIALADHSATGERSLMIPFTESAHKSLKSIFDEMARPLKEKLKNMGAAPEKIKLSHYLDLRPKGSEGYLTVTVTGYRATRNEFLAAFVKRFGFEPERQDLEIVNARVEVSASSGQLVNKSEFFPDRRVEPPRKAGIYFESGLRETDLIRKNTLEAGQIINGPALIIDNHCTILIEEFFTARVDEKGQLHIKDIKTAGKPSSGVKNARSDKKNQADPVLLEVFNHAFQSIAEQMGETLKKTAHSVNMKERFDFSCAVFDREGNLVANAPHIPVHLGAIGESVKNIIEENAGRLKPGQVYVTNHPAKGGSHLPDVTLITPVFVRKENVPGFFVATRGHHADIGGKTPGSMSPFSKSLAEEGVVIDNFLLVENSVFNRKGIEAILKSGPYPARDLPERISDLVAQTAANHKGERELLRLVGEHGISTVDEYMRRIRENAAYSLRLALGRLLGGQDSFVSSFEDHMDDGAVIKVSLRVDKGGNPPGSHTVSLCFDGTSPQLDNSLNAPFCVVRSAVLYVFRTLIDNDIPLNDGCMIPVKLEIPPGSILNPSPQAAVAGGNVETSQRIVDVILGALGVAGASQGTMNNITMGWSKEAGNSFSGRYYETIAGGAGAVEGCHGASATQVHMTNTRITDPEILEIRFPGVRLKQFAIRRGSGGGGRYRGGDGVIREFEFLEPCEVTLFCERRNYAPYGAKGGEAGRTGVDSFVSGGKTGLVPGRAALKFKAGDTLKIETPGGGGIWAS